jgi:hypothetical protein
MIKNSFIRIYDWPYHTNMIMFLGYVAGLYFATGGDTPLWMEIVAAFFLMVPLGFIILIPYFLTVVALAALFSLLQAIRTRFRRPFPTTHSTTSQ